MPGHPHPPPPAKNTLCPAGTAAVWENRDPKSITPIQPWVPVPAAGTTPQNPTDYISQVEWNCGNAVQVHLNVQWDTTRPLANCSYRHHLVKCCYRALYSVLYLPMLAAACVCVQTLPRLLCHYLPNLLTSNHAVLLHLHCSVHETVDTRSEVSKAAADLISRHVGFLLCLWALVKQDSRDGWRAFLTNGLFNQRQPVSHAYLSLCVQCSVCVQGHARLFATM